jgi:hypothetical protein
MNADRDGKIAREPAMSAQKLTARTLYGLDCVQCGDDMIAPETSEYIGERRVRHFWHCTACGCRAEETAFFCAEAGAQRLPAQLCAA